MATEKTSADVFVMVVENGIVKKTAVSTDMQIGYVNSPAELYVTGKVCHSVAVIEGVPGKTLKHDGYSTFVCITNSGGNGDIVFNLTASPQIGQVCYVKDASGRANVNNIVLTPLKGTIDGEKSKRITARYESLQMVWTGSDWSTFGRFDEKELEPGPASPDAFSVNFCGRISSSISQTTHYIMPGGIGSETAEASSGGNITPYVCPVAGRVVSFTLKQFTATGVNGSGQPLPLTYGVGIFGGSTWYEINTTSTNTEAKTLSMQMPVKIGDSIVVRAVMTDYANYFSGDIRIAATIVVEKYP